MILRSPIASRAKLALYKLIGLSPAGERFLDVYLSRRAFRKAYGRYPDLDNPTLFGEKMVARKLFDRHPIFHTLSDKFLVRDWVAERIGSQHLPKMLQICERFDDIEFDRLPYKFAIKPNHGSHFIILVDDKQAMDKAAARRLVHRWMDMDYYVASREWAYKGISRKILIEELLEESSGAPIIDYRFFVFDGVPQFLYVSHRQSVHGRRTVTFYDRDCHRLPMSVLIPNCPLSSKDSAERFAFPANMDELFDIAARLGQGFDFMRVDLYNPGNKVIFGEMTIMAGGGVRPFEPLTYERLFGDHWKQVVP